VAALRNSTSPPREHETELSSLAQIVQHLPEVEPMGIILHVTRCGSTLLSNALSAGENVFSVGEAPAFDKAAQFPPSRDARTPGIGTRSLRDFCKTFAYYRGADATQVIIKTGLGAVTRLSAIRAAWPKVPCVMLIRDPIEVAVSNLQSPSRTLLDWYHTPSSVTSAVPEEALRGSIAEFCAWVVGWTCTAALDQLDEKCLLLDYRDLTPDAALRVADFFTIRLTAEGKAALQRAFLHDAKRGGEFTPDVKRKEKAATTSLADSIDRWAREPYEALLRSSLRLRSV
jgi:hypothetical protein